MTTDSEGVPAGALEDVAYLTRSINRIEILAAVADEPRTRSALTAVGDASRTTVDRIVNELEQRGWVERTADGEYAATTTGSHLVAELEPCLDAVAAIRRLGRAVEWLPADELTIGLEHFRDASVYRPERDDPIETVDLMVDLVHETSEIRVLTHLSPPIPIAQAMADGVTTGRLRGTYVVTPDLIATLREHPDRRERWRTMLRAGAGVYRYDGALPCNLFVFDGTVLLKKSRPGHRRESYGVPIVSENDTVRAWANELFERYRADATPVDAETFETEPASH